MRTKENIEEKRGLDEFLRSRGVSPSFQRIRILEYLIKNRTHPSAEEIHRKIVCIIPTLSKTTVYNTLNLFVEKGVVKRLGIDDAEARFDIDMEEHAHFQCISCGKIFDLKEKNISINDKLEGHLMLEASIYIKGYCRDCSSEKNGKTEKKGKRGG